MAQVLRGAPNGRGKRVAVAVARFNEEITSRLLDGALQACAAAGVAAGDVTVAWVPGAFELPAACQWLAATRRFDAIVLLGAVVRGDTDHYQWVCHAATEGALRVGLERGLPLGFGVLTCATEEQALARAGGAHGNKGADAVHAALAMADLRTQIAAMAAG